jgi:hypothetical protein
LCTLLIATPARDAPAQDADFAILARGGAPTAMSLAATVAYFDTATKKVRILYPGTNGLTCTVLPDGSSAPFCGDANAWQWMVDALSGKPKPTNTGAGVAYMAQGGWHFETPDGTIVMAPGESTKAVQEPPHWMLLWPVSAKVSGLPTTPNPGGVYVMFDGTPYAHLMIYQDPATWVP